MRISDWSSDVCSSDLGTGFGDMPRAFDMERLKIAIQHPDQVDHRIRAGDGPRKTVGPAHVGGDELRLPAPAERLQKSRLAVIALRDPHAPALLEPRLRHDRQHVV